MVTSDVAIDPIPINEDALVFTTVDDSTMGGSNIESAAYFDGADLFNMEALDGAYDEVSEAVWDSVISYPTPGVHPIYVMDSDTA